MNRTVSSKLAQPLLFAIVFAHACTPAVADPTGSTSEVRKTDPFKAIEIVGTIEVEARIDATTRVEVHGDAARLKQVITSVKNGVLAIDTKGKLDRDAKLRVVVSAPNLDAFTISGTGDLRVTGLAGGTIDASIPGTGSMRLAGKVATLRLAIAGTGEVRAKDLIADSAIVDVKGTGEVQVHATRALDATIAGTGAIRVHGRPASVKKSVTGTGVVDLH